MRRLGVQSQTTREERLKGSAHSKNEDSYFLAPAQTKGGGTERRLLDTLTGGPAMGSNF